MKIKYTVLLGYPEYLNNQKYPYTYLAHVEGRNVENAVAIAQEDLAQENEMDIQEVRDCKPIAVFLGHLIDQFVHLPEHAAKNDFGRNTEW